jgi:hypothetical protein
MRTKEEIKDLVKSLSEDEIDLLTNELSHRVIMPNYMTKNGFKCMLEEYESYKDLYKRYVREEKINNLLEDRSEHNIFDNMFDNLADELDNDQYLSETFHNVVYEFFHSVEE